MSGSDATLYKCGCAASAPVAQTSGSRIDNAIDVHCHVITDEVTRLVSGRPEAAAMTAMMPKLMGQASFDHNLALEKALSARVFNPATRLADMDVMGVGIQVVSPAPVQYHYWADAALSERLVTVQNEHIAGLCNAFPDRFLGLGAASMQHPELAERQLVQLMRAGFKGIEISTRVAERELSDPAFERIWTVAAEAGAVVFIHPLGSTLGTRLADHYLANIVGQPVETTIAISQLAFGGVLDRHPTLKLIAAHGGGFLPGYAGRSDHGYAVRPEARRGSSCPSDVLRRIWYDTVVHSPAVLANLVAVAGASQVLLGTDYPYDMGEYRMAALLDSTPGLSRQDREAIVSGNAKRLLGLR